jgi:hypothetical protein
MKQDIAAKLDAITRSIDSKEYLVHARSCSEWGGADVIISSHMSEEIQVWLRDNRLVISLQQSEPQRRAVITPCSRELSWLLEELRAAFAGIIDYASKYDFYGTLAQSAIDHLAARGNRAECSDLLMAVLDQAKRMI